MKERSPKLLVAFASGALFAAGLAVGGMTQTAKVTGFLDVAGAWDPSLLFVMLGAIAVYGAAIRLAKPRVAANASLPTKAPVDPKLGTFAASPPVDAPWVAPFAVEGLTFLPNLQVEGRYTVEADSGGQRRVQPIDVRQPVPPLRFSFE